VKILVFDDIATASLEEENLRKNKKDRSTNSQEAKALIVVRRRSTESDLSGSQNHSKSKLISKKNLKCYHYGKKGHLKKDY